MIADNWFHRWAIFYRKELCMTRLLYGVCTTFKSLSRQLPGIKKLIKNLIWAVQSKLPKNKIKINKMSGSTIRLFSSVSIATIARHRSYEADLPRLSDD